MNIMQSICKLVDYGIKTFFNHYQSHPLLLVEVNTENHKEKGFSMYLQS
jgi:hypothetical protein